MGKLVTHSEFNVEDTSVLNSSSDDWSEQLTSQLQETWTLASTNDTSPRDQLNRGSIFQHSGDETTSSTRPSSDEQNTMDNQIISMWGTLGQDDGNRQQNENQIL